jgi:hypothetical protein
MIRITSCKRKQKQISILNKLNVEKKLKKINFIKGLLKKKQNQPVLTFKTRDPEINL